MNACKRQPYYSEKKKTPKRNAILRAAFFLNKNKNDAFIPSIINLEDPTHRFESEKNQFQMRVFMVMKEDLHHVLFFPYLPRRKEKKRIGEKKSVRRWEASDCFPWVPSSGALSRFFFLSLRDKKSFGFPIIGKDKSKRYGDSRVINFQKTLAIFCWTSWHISVYK